MAPLSAPIAVILGTRPEIIKLAPIIYALRAQPGLAPYILFTGQHDSMAAQALNAFGIEPDSDLKLMTEGQAPGTFLATALMALGDALAVRHFAGVIVQGDTSTSLAGALAGFHARIPVAHVEAGLRTYDLQSPFPEEMNRTVISRLANLHFCATERGRENLAREAVTKGVYVTGNTVVDALQLMMHRMESGAVEIDPAVKALPLERRRLLLVTGHRRENFDQPLVNLCRVLRRLVDAVPDIDVVYPVHLNPQVQRTVHSALETHPRIHLLTPVDYPSLLRLIQASALIITDSGGIQEEAPSFSTRVLVTRSHSDGPESIEHGCAELTPLHAPDALYFRALKELTTPDAFPKIQRNPFGDGAAASRIVSILTDEWGVEGRDVAAQPAWDKPDIVQ